MLSFQKMQVINIIKYIFSKNRNEIKAWHDMLGFYPNNLALYRLAVTHRSAQIKDSDGNVISNERLEYLGDAFLGAIIADLLYHRFPNATEGFLTRTRSKLVCRANLNNVCHNIGLDKLVNASHGLKHNAQNLYGNAIEAIVGAIYLDQGYKRTERWVLDNVALKNLQHNLDEVVQIENDYKSRLYEWAQIQHKTIEFILIDHQFAASIDQHTYTYQLQIDGQRFTTGSGTNKRLAQQNAAKKAIKKLI